MRAPAHDDRAATVCRCWILRFTFLHLLLFQLFVLVLLLLLLCAVACRVRCLAPPATAALVVSLFQLFCSIVFRARALRRVNRPFATGLPHYGHILTGTIKDIVTRYATQTGHYVSRRCVQCGCVRH